jgi:O-antigen/teichoic acid export membrane protein
MTLLRTSLLSLASTIVKMLAGLAISKTLAVVTGPSGLALVGQFQNFVQIALTTAKGALDTGVTKYTAEYGADEARRARLFSTAARLCACSCAVVALVLLLASEPLSRYLLHSSDHAYVLRLFGLTVALFVLNSLLLAIVNGLQEIRTYILVNIAQSLLTLLLTVGLIAWLGLDGALIALVTNQSLVLVVLLWMLRGHMVIKIVHFRSPFDRVEAIRLSKYSLMTAVSAVVSPLTAITVRDHIASTLSINQAGYWQAMWYVSTVYLTIVTTSLSVYYLPKLAATSDRHALRSELLNGYRVIMPIVIAAALMLYVMREWVVLILFSDAFSPMLLLFRWMLIGDVIKLASWLVAYLMLAKAMTRAFIVTEVVFSASFVALVMILTEHYGLEGVTYAYAVNYTMYLVAVATLTRRYWL